MEDRLNTFLINTEQIENSLRVRGHVNIKEQIKYITALKFPFFSEYRVKGSWYRQFDSRS